VIIHLIKLTCGRDLAKQFKAWAGGFQRLVEPDIDNTPPAAACLDALFGQIKWARSIENFNIHLFPSDEVPMFDMQQFVASNKPLEYLRIISRHFDTGPSWCTAWSNSCSHTAQETWPLWMLFCKWWIARTVTLGAYQGGEYADQCAFISHYSRLSAFLQDPTNSLKTVHVYDFDYSDANGDVVGHENFRLLSAGLNGNAKLTSLGLNRLGGIAEWSASCNDCFCKLLCKTTSIESIYNSNHTLEYMSGFAMSSQLTQYFELNENGDKKQVIRNKILKYYLLEILM
jgi:hypothetical protein